MKDWVVEVPTILCQDNKGQCGNILICYHNNNGPIMALQGKKSVAYVRFEGTLVEVK